jgi:hypothetical protein
MAEYTNVEDETYECQYCESRFEEDEYNMESGLCHNCLDKEIEEEEDETYDVMDQFFLEGFEMILKEADKYLEDREIKQEARREERKQESDYDSDYESDDGDDLSGDPKLPRKVAERIIKCHINYNFRQQDVEKFFKVMENETPLEEEVFEFAENWDIEEDRNKELQKCKTDLLYKQKLMRYAWSDYLLNKLIEENYFDISYF